IIEELGISNNIEIYNQFVPTEDVKLYFSACDMVTQTYHTASQSGITQMALNYNKAVLVTNVGGLSEIILDRKSGYVVEKTANSIATALNDFYTNNREAAFSSQAAIEKKKYSWENLSKQVIEFVENLEIRK